MQNTTITGNVKSRKMLELNSRSGRVRADGKTKLMLQVDYLTSEPGNSKTILVPKMVHVL